MLGLDNPIHIAFLLIVLLLVFGAKRLPELGQSLGSGMRGFKDAISGESTAHNPLHAVAHDQSQAPAYIPSSQAAPTPAATPTPAPVVGVQNDQAA